MILNSVTVKNGRFLIPHEQLSEYKWLNSKSLVKTYVWKDWSLSIKNREIIVDGPSSVKYPLNDGVLYLCSKLDNKDYFRLNVVDLEKSFKGAFNQVTCYSLEKSYGDYRIPCVEVSKKNNELYTRVLEYINQRNLLYAKMKPMYFYTKFLDFNFIRSCKKYNITEVIEEFPDGDYKVGNSINIITDGIVQDRYINKKHYNTVRDSLFVFECKKSNSDNLDFKQSVAKLKGMKVILHSKENLLTLEYLIDTALEVYNDF